MDKIIFFDSKSVIDAYIENKRFSEAAALCIAMHPAVCAYLKQKGFSQRNTTSYFTNDSHTRMLEKSDMLIEWLTQNSQFVDFGSGIQYAFRNSFIFSTRLAIHYCLRIIEVVSNAVDFHEPLILSAKWSGKRPVSSVFFEPEERYLGDIVRIIARDRGLECEDVPSDVVNGSKPSIARFCDYAASLLKCVLKYEKFWLYEKRFLLNNIFTKKRPFFFTTKFYQLDKFVQRLQKEFPDAPFHLLYGPIIPNFPIQRLFIKLFWERYSQEIRRQKSLFDSLVTTIGKERVVFSYRDISFAHIISHKIRENIANYILALMLWTVKLNRFIDVSRPSAFISNGNRADDVILAELCQIKKINTFLISHGSHVRPKNRYENIEWGEHGKSLIRAPFSYIALQSPLAEGYLEAFPTKSKIIKTGPLIWGTPVNREKSRLLFNKIFGNKYGFGEVKIIVHAGTPKMSYGSRLYVYETSDEYIQALSELASVINKMANTILIIRFRPSKEIEENDLKSFIPFSEKVILSMHEPFLEVLGMADLLVSFSSTAIEEALQNRIPVLLYGGRGRYQHISAYEIKTNTQVPPCALYHVREARELEYAMARILELEIDGITKDKELFDRYIYNDDERRSLDVFLSKR